MRRRMLSLLYQGLGKRVGSLSQVLKLTLPYQPACSHRHLRLRSPAAHRAPRQGVPLRTARRPGKKDHFFLATAGEQLDGNIHDQIFTPILFRCHVNGRTMQQAKVISARGKTLCVFSSIATESCCREDVRVRSDFARSRQSQKRYEFA